MSKTLNSHIFLLKWNVRKKRTTETHTPAFWFSRKDAVQQVTMKAVIDPSATAFPHCSYGAVFPYVGMVVPTVHFCSHTKIIHHFCPYCKIFALMLLKPPFLEQDWHCNCTGTWFLSSAGSTAPLPVKERKKQKSKEIFYCHSIISLASIRRLNVIQSCSIVVFC